MNLNGTQVQDRQLERCRRHQATKPVTAEQDPTKTITLIYTKSCVHVKAREHE